MRETTAMLRPLRRLRRDSRGVTIIEFSFAAPVLMIFILGIVDGGRALSAKLSIDQAAYRSLEQVAVGTVQTDYTFVKTEAAAAAGVPTSQVTVNAWLECDGTKQTNFTDSCADTEQTTRYVQVTITKTFAPSFGYGKWFLGADASGNVNMSTTSAIRIQ